MEKDVGLKEAFCERGGAIVSDFDKNCSCESDTLTGLDDKPWLLHEFHVLPLWVARYGLEQPLAGDCGAVRVVGRHKREFEERGHSSVEHLNVHCVDLLQLLCQNGVIVGIQHLRKGEDEVAT